MRRSPTPDRAARPQQPGRAAARAFLRGVAARARRARWRAGPAGTRTGPAAAGRRPASIALDDAEPALPPVPFHGRYQAGILPQPQRQTAVISFDVTADSAAELTDLFQTITGRARFLTAGGTPPPVGIGGPPSDSGVLGPTVVPDGLTVTVGVGSSLFDDRYGLAAQQPARLTPMQPFPDDDLDPAQAGGDLILQLSAGNADTVLHALRDIAKHTRGGMQVNWRIDGFTSPARPAGTVAAQPARGSWTASPTRPSTDAGADGRAGLGPAGHRGRAGLDRGRQLPGRPADPDAGRVLGPGRHHRAGEHDRPPPRHRLPAGRERHLRHARLRAGPHRRR